MGSHVPESAIGALEGELLMQRQVKPEGVVIGGVPLVKLELHLEIVEIAGLAEGDQQGPPARERETHALQQRAHAVEQAPIPKAQETVPQAARTVVGTRQRKERQHLGDRRMNVPRQHARGHGRDGNLTRRSCKFFSDQGKSVLSDGRRGLTRRV